MRAKAPLTTTARRRNKATAIVSTLYPAMLEVAGNPAPTSRVWRMSALRRPKFSRTYTISIFAGRLSIQSEFSFQTPKFNGHPEHRCYFPVGTRAQLDDPISRAAAIRFWQWASRTEVPNDEDEILSGSAAARIVTFYASYASGRNAR